MLIERGGIHRRLSFLIQHCGGYDREYHIKKVAEKICMDVDLVRLVFDKSPRSRLHYFLKKLEDGVNIENIMKAIECENRAIAQRFQGIYSIMGALAAQSPYGTLFR